MTSKSKCPGCGTQALGASFELKDQPVILNYRFGTAEEAKEMPRRDMLLRECLGCGLIFNAILDEAAIPYDQRYENRQGFSDTFQAMLEDTADGLIQRHNLTHGRILEVGCGKGDFLRLITMRAQGTGIGYDTSCELEGWDESSRVCFLKRYVGPEDVTEKFGLIICRHVVEHISEVGAFFRLLHAVAMAAGGAPVYVETPAFEWCVEQGAFWDVFYEHCNYFPTRTLRRIAELAGFHVVKHSLLFGEQYQGLEISPVFPGSPVPALPTADGPVLEKFTRAVQSSRDSLQKKLAAAGAERGWAIWGAGAKGVSISYALHSSLPAYVVDSNPAKQGKFLPGTGVPVIPPDDPRLATVPVLLVANTNYLPEIRRSLATYGLSPQILAIDSSLPFKSGRAPDHA